MLDWLTNNIESIIAIPVVIPIVIYAAWGIRQSRQKRRRQIQRNSIPCKHVALARIPDPSSSMERYTKYEKPLEETLISKYMGRVSGGGTQLMQVGLVSWVDIEIELTNLDTALEITRQRLVELGAPPGSALEYRAGKNRIKLQLH